ncbi:LysR family transcriptional regulator [Bordetella ansorpii]|uniref:LysR family transcriptional regulator n=1 Tax=Bordetella ansorpii TaxID=288768 RepID=A0A157NEG1_9BORD|nr:LysR family transcriptional regulator [Bordetella ansorpii]SAI19633.1 LysR family transcriptional regulator [Bordetella ansorpii]
MFSRRELTLLRAMYREGTVTAAAATIGMSQPAASAMLRDMDVRLGFALFSREGRRLRMTSQARALIPEVLNALTALESADRVAGDIRHGAMSRLVIGVVAIAASSLLPPALTHMRRTHPAVAITMRAGSALEIIEMAVDHRIDLGIIVGSPTDSQRVATMTLAPLALHAVLHPSHPWASKKRLKLADVVASEPILLSTALPAGRATRQAILAQGLPYRPLTEASQSSAACALVAEGLGIAIVESLGAHYASRQGLVTRQLVRLDDPVLALVWARDRAMSEPGECLRDALMKEAAKRLGRGAA